MAMSLHINLTIFLYGHEAFWQFSSMAVSTKINFIYFLLSPWLTDGNFSCENHLRCFWQFSCVALNFFDNFTVWPWPYKFISKKFDNFPVWFFDNFPVWIFDNFPVWVFDNFPVPHNIQCLGVKSESPGKQIVMINTIMHANTKMWISLNGILLICNEK